MEPAGDISFEGSHTVLWKIRDFFTLMKKQKLVDDICSPSFSYINNVWIMKINTMYPFEKPYETWICLRVSSKVSQAQRYILRCGIRKEDSDLYSSVSSKEFYNGFAYLISEADFFGKRSEFAPYSDVTFFVQYDSVPPPPSATMLVTSPEQLLTSNKLQSEPETENSDFGILSQHLKDLYLSGKESDMAFQVGDRKFQVHKVILGARSSVFSAMIHHDVKEDDKTVDVIDCEADDFHEFLLYLYSGKVEKLSTDNVVGLYTLADKYMVDGLKLKCIDHLKKNMNVDIFCSAADLAVRHEETEFLKYLKGYFTKNAKKIISSPYWNSFMKENTTLASELLLLVVRDCDQY